VNYRAPIIAVVLSALLGAGYYFLLWQPKNEELEEIRTETAQLESQRSQLQNELRRLQEIEEREIDYRAALARLEEYIPTGTAQAAIIRHFQLSADAAGVTIQSVSFAEPSPVNDAPSTGTPDTVLASINTTMVVEGGYFQAVDFFRRVEVDIPRAVLMQNLAMGEAEAFPVLSTNWTGQMFTVIPDPSPAPPPAPTQDADGEAGVDDSDPDEVGEDTTATGNPEEAS
jgi:Tfp pilus assembly protein PilO